MKECVCAVSFFFLASCAVFVPTGSGAASDSLMPGVAPNLASSHEISPATIQSRKGNEKPSDFIWDLGPLYEDTKAWESAYSSLDSSILRLAGKVHTVPETPGHFADMLDEAYELRSEATKLALYGLLSYQVDVDSEIARSQETRGRLIESRVKAQLAFLTPIIESIPSSQLRGWIGEEPRLDRHRTRINRIRNEAPYTKGPQIDALLERATRWSQVSGDGYWVLMDSAIEWPEYDEAGHQARFDYWAFQRERRQGRLMQRESIVEEFYTALEGFDDLFAHLLTRRIEADIFLARERGFDSGSGALFFFRDGLPEGSAEAMVLAAKRNKPTIQRYLSYKKRQLGTPFTYFDLNQQPAPIERDFQLSDALEIMRGAARTIGPDYLKAVTEVLDRDLMHLPPADHKQPEYAVYPPIGGAPPYFIFSYAPSHRHSRALAGAVILMTRWSGFAPGYGPDTRDDPPIFANGLIFAGDLLHDEHLINSATSNKERRQYLEHALDFLWEYAVRWVIASEFELAIEQRVMNDDFPDGRDLHEIYLGILKGYVAPEESDISIPEIFGREWMTHPVSFASFEQMNWPAAMAVAALLVERLKSGDLTARKAFLPGNTTARTDRSYDQFKEVGIDLSNQSSYDALFRRMDALIEEIDRTEL